MSLGTIGNYKAVMEAMQSGSAAGTASAKDTDLQSAFNTQMRMARSLFGDGKSSQEDGSTSSFDTSFVNDAMMFEALTTISRLMRSEAGLQQRPSVSRSGKERFSVGAHATGESSPALTDPVEKTAVRTAEMGSLSARFESGSGGIATIGYDRVGGTSYGKYQIASKPGTMNEFLGYLDRQAPDLAARLREAGPANTGSKEGAMPEVWKRIATEDPDRFEKLQHDFIATKTYDPARSMILGQTGLDFDNAPPALREVLWSTAVQHGPTGAARIFNKVIDQFVGGAEGNEFNNHLIEGVYDTRKGQFSSSSKRVQNAVVSRLNAEKTIALDMLSQPRINRIV